MDRESIGVFEIYDFSLDVVKSRRRKVRSEKKLLRILCQNGAFASVDETGVYHRITCPHRIEKKYRGTWKNIQWNV